MKRIKPSNILDGPTLDGSCHALSSPTSQAPWGVPSVRVTRLCIAILTAISLSIFINIGNTYAENFDANVTIKPSLTLDISSDKISMSLDPASKTYDEKDLTVSIGTNNSYGYKLYLSASGTDLVNIADGTKTIPTLPTTTPAGYDINSMPVNYWGYRLTKDSTISSGNYLPFPSTATSANSFIISESDKPVNNNISTLGFASKIDYTTPSGVYELTLNFKALPIVTQYYMQNLDPTLCTEEPTVVIDNRDNQTYTIQRLKDGKCWMMTNLNLGAYDLETDLTSANTNLATAITASEFNGWRKTTPTGTYTDGEYIPVTDENSPNGTEIDPVNNLQYGTLYNYYAASAKSVSGTLVGYDATSDICPAGWRLPTGGPGGEYETLYSYYNSYDLARASFIINDGLAFTLAGFFQASSPQNPSLVGTDGSNWSSTRYGGNATTGVHVFGIGIKSGVNAIERNNRACGSSVRCILK